MTILLEELNAKGKCTLPIGTAALPSPSWQQGQEWGRAVLGGSWAVPCPGQFCLHCFWQLPASLPLELGGI